MTAWAVLLMLIQVATHKILGIPSHFSLKRFHDPEAFRSVGNRGSPAFETAQPNRFCYIIGNLDYVRAGFGFQDRQCLCLVRFSPKTCLEHCPASLYRLAQGKQSKKKNDYQKQSRTC